MCLKKGASIKDKKVLFLCLKDIKMKRWKSTFMHFRSTNCTTQAPVPCLTFQSKGTVKGTDGRARGSNPAPQQVPRTPHCSIVPQAPCEHYQEEKQEQLLRITWKECQKIHCSSLESLPEGLELDTAQMFPLRHILQSPLRSPKSWCLVSLDIQRLIAIILSSLLKISKRTAP